MHFLIDANLAAGYYLPGSLSSKKERVRIKSILNYIKKGGDHFVYIPNFCVAETFNVFAKYSFGKWNRHVKIKGKAIGIRRYQKLVEVFERDVHNGKFFYHYELNRYHILDTEFVSPIDHHYQGVRSKKKNKVPMSTFDHLIIAMGIELAHIHGRDKVCILSSDDRLNYILDKCKKNPSKSVIKRLKLPKVAERVRGLEFSANLFPEHLNLKRCSEADLKRILGSSFSL